MPTAEYETFLKNRRSEILDKVSDVCRITGRSASDIDIVAVSKTVDTETLQTAYRVGWKHFGENRPQELNKKLAELQKIGPLPVDLIFDMIGNLQTNKINMLLGKVRLIHSVSTSHLAEAISKRVDVSHGKLPVLLELNISGEASKSGFSKDELSGQFEALCALSGIDIKGFMTMAPKDDRYQAQKTFEGLRLVAEDYRARYDMSLPYLSGGMSDDFELALKEGTNIIRLGRILFDSLYNMN